MDPTFIMTMRAKLSHLDNLTNCLINNTTIKHTFNIEIKSIYDLIEMYHNLSIPCENLKYYGKCQYGKNC